MEISNLQRGPQAALFLPAFFACTLFGPWALASLFGSAFWIALLVALFGSAFGLRFWVD